MDRSVEKLVALLDVVAASGPAGLTTMEVAERLGWPKGTASRALRALEEYAILERDPRSRVYYVGPKVLRWASALIQPGVRLAAVRRRLAATARHLGYCTYLCEMVGARVICTDVAYPAYASRYYVHVGAPMPYYASAGAKAIVTALPREDLLALMHREPPEAITDQTITDPGAILADLAACRERGYATCYSEMEPAVGAVSVPAQLDGRLVSISVVGGEQAVRKQERELVHALRRLVDELQELGRLPTR